MATVFGPRGVSMTAEKGRSWPFSMYTRILTGVLSGPCQSSMSASSGRPSVLRSTWTCSTAGERYDQVRREPPCTRIAESTPGGARVRRTAPVPVCVPMAAGAPSCITGGAVRRARGGAFDASAQVGATAPLGYWDPAGFCSDGKEETFDSLRGKELKHARVAMMAIVGFLGTGAGWRFPGFESVPDGVSALQNGAGPGLGIFFLLFGFFELKIMDDLEKGNKPGNFGDPFKMATTGLLGGYDENWRNFELNNGRMAMLGVIGTIVASAYTDLDVYCQWQQGKEASIAFLKLTLPYSP